MHATSFNLRWPSNPQKGVMFDMIGYRIEPLLKLLSDTLLAGNPKEEEIIFFIIGSLLCLIFQIAKYFHSCAATDVGGAISSEQVHFTSEIVGTKLVQRTII
jgi:hypothetical protein